MKFRLWRKKKNSSYRQQHKSTQTTPQVSNVYRWKSSASTGLGQEKLAERKRQKRAQRVRNFVAKLIRNWKYIFLGLITLAVLASVGFIIYLLNTTTTFQLQIIEIVGNEQLTVEEVRRALSDVQGRSMFSFDATVLEYRLLDEFTYLRSVYIRKLLPSKLEVRLEERFPVIAYINLSGVYLVDEDRIVIAAPASEEVEPLSDAQLAILSGFGNPEAEIVRRYFESDPSLVVDVEGLPEDEVPEWEEIDIEDKRKLLEQVRSDVRGLLTGRWDEAISGTDATEVGDVVIVLATGNQQLEVGSELAPSKFTMLMSIERYFSAKEVRIEQVEWLTDFNIVVKLANYPDVYFTSIRPVEEQLQALEVVSSEEDLGERRVVDLRSELVSVR